MMYSEFAEAVGCRDNAHNHKVFENLEAMYMNTDMTKEDIYEYGRKLVDNSKSEEQLKLESEINAEIEQCKRMIANYKIDIEWKNSLMDEFDKEWNKQLKAEIRYYKEQIKVQRNRIASLKWVLEE